MYDIHVKFIICTFYEMFNIEDCTVLQIFCPVLSDFDKKKFKFDFRNSVVSRCFFKEESESQL